jgi:hypothetical protein
VLTIQLSISYQAFLIANEIALMSRSSSKAAIRARQGSHHWFTDIFSEAGHSHLVLSWVKTDSKFADSQWAGMAFCMLFVLDK